MLNFYVIFHIDHEREIIIIYVDYIVRETIFSNIFILFFDGVCIVQIKNIEIKFKQINI